MPSNSSVKYQWQNPHLRETIYPFRNLKLRDFLLIYKEIDLWKAMRNKPVDSQLAAELIQLHTDSEKQLAVAKLEKDQIKKGIQDTKKKHRAALNQRHVRLMRSSINRLEIKLGGLESKKKTLERQISWYAKFAPDHPYYERWKGKLEQVMVPYNETQVELQETRDTYHIELAPYEAEVKELEVRKADNALTIQRLTEQKKNLPPLDRQGNMNQRSAVRWLVHKYEQELLELDHDQLLAEVLKRFDDEPGRFPKWLQYMVLHFSGMRYRSAHGSWADPRDLLEIIKLDDVKTRMKSAPESELAPAKNVALAAYEKEKIAAADARQKQRIEYRIRALKSSNWRAELGKYESAKVVEEVEKLSDQAVITRLKGMKGRFPPWAWKELVSRTDLRLETTDTNWEELTREERLDRWRVESGQWREIMNYWERQDITGWRQEHNRSLALIVTRAVCNEISEHIQHLRGVKPGAGLTAKPQWYLNRQKVDPQNVYLRRGSTSDDFKTGSSILFLGWTSRRPNAWQIARPLGGIDLLPAPFRPAKVKKKNVKRGKDDEWRYQTQGKFERSSRPFIKKRIPVKGKKNKYKEKTVRGPMMRQWLRWTHEAMVVDVAEMTGGTYVLTFETGKIGLNLRPLRRMTNHWDIYVGYVPRAPIDPANLDKMLDRNTILPGVEELPPAFEFGILMDEPAPPAALVEELEHEKTLADLQSQRAATLDTVQKWESLTLRQKQVVALVAQGYTTREIATRLDTSTGNIRSHISRAMGKFGFHRREEFQDVLGDWDFSALGNLVK